MVADGPAATAAMWSYLIGLDLTRSLEYWIAAPDTPFANLLQGPYRPRVDLGQNLWVRLVDVGAALAARTYAAPFEVVFDVADAFCPWNAGRHRLAWDGTTAACERTDAAADLALRRRRARRGVPRRHEPRRARVDRPRARAARGCARPGRAAFKAAREPWCPEIF